MCERVCAWAAWYVIREFIISARGVRPPVEVDSRSELDSTTPFILQGLRDLAPLCPSPAPLSGAPLSRYGFFGESVSP